MAVPTSSGPRCRSMSSILDTVISESLPSRKAIPHMYKAHPIVKKNYKWNRHIEHELIKKFNCNSDLLEMVLKDFKK